ncbi:MULTISPECIES: CocE/NonD family hydrolase [unclassified Bradyrhizobium]|uniref:CocE/NonD family hydrolase n=1 Tax=unclassified Bradyrhizobium TaxID=2631580 RepID=UPI001FEEFD12|nr:MULTISPECIES: CocE/NonD family hydrolase [unclassified Bradyrhizobium]
MTTKSEVRDGMRVDWDVEIKMPDGVILRCDIFRPLGEEPVPALMTYGPYGKGLAWQDGYQTAWEILERDNPDAVANTSNLYQCWEVPDPEKWVPDGYALVRVDSRGAGRSEGFLAVSSPQETQDIYDCIEWLARQPWCSGKIGMNGISYYGANQWRAAAKRPPHLAAICIWEGYSDSYREASRHGGIFCTFGKNWFNIQVLTLQHGLGDSGRRSRVTGETVCGPETFTDEELARNRVVSRGLLAHPLEDASHRAANGDLLAVEIPLLSAANWGGQGLHLRGNVEGYLGAASKQKWLAFHGGAHWAEFYTDYGVAMQKRFFGHFLKGERTGWEDQPPIQMQIRRPGETKFAVRHENEWPLARTQWTEFYLDFERMSLTTEPSSAPSKLDYRAMGEGLTFKTAPFETETEITGPVASRLLVSSKTVDADVFLVLRLFDADDREVTFFGAVEPHAPIGQGWLRASHRKLDQAKTTPYRPYHSHDELQPLIPDVPVRLDVEIWPTCIVVPKGYRIGLTVLGRDYEWDGAATFLSTAKNMLKGSGPFLHDDPEDRPSDIFGGINTLHFDPGNPPFVLLPVIPSSDSAR